MYVRMLCVLHVLKNSRKFMYLSLVSEPGRAFCISNKISSIVLLLFSYTK